MRTGNLYENVPGDLTEELIDVLAGGHGNVRIERIVSRGHSSPPDFWYDQETIEWVVLLKGSAILRFKEKAEPVEMKPGDWIEIPAHCLHRVEETAGDVETVWLAVHWG